MSIPFTKSGRSANALQAVLMMLSMLCGLLICAAAPLTNAATMTECLYVTETGAASTLQPAVPHVIACADFETGRVLTVDPNAPAAPPAVEASPLPPPVSAYIQLADVGTTAVAIAGGLGSEGNPLLSTLTEGPAGFVALAGLKLGMTAYARTKPPERCVRTLRIKNALTGGAVLNNIAIIAGAASGGAVAAGVIGGVLAWHYTEDSAAAECAAGVPALLLTARVRERIRSHR